MKSTDLPSKRIVRMAASGGGAPIDCEWANGFVGRLIGLMGRAGMPEGAGLMLVPCNGIHMWFMRFAIDAVFLQKRGDAWRVTSIFENIPAWKLLPVGDRRALAVLELPAGGAARHGLRVGEELACIG